MTYRRSRALRDFRKAIGRPRKLLELEKRLPDPPTIRVRLKSESLRGGAIVLVSATFEAFLKETLAEYVENISRKVKHSDNKRLPKSFSMNNGLNYVEYLKHLKKTERHLELKSHATIVSKRLISSKSFDKTYSNPGSECVERMLKDLGIGEVWPRISEEFDAHHLGSLPPNIIKIKLDSYVNWRNEVAHNGVASNLTRKDLQDAVLFYEALASSIDKTLYRFVSAL